MLRRTHIATGVVLAGAALIGAAPADAGRHHRHHQRKTIHIGDNYFAPTKLKVHKGARITWKWPSFENSGNVHDVKLKRAPKGVRKRRFHSQPASSDYRFRRTLRRPGLYRFICTFHAGMKVTIRVRRH